jgi:hypothetical protein
MIMKKMVLIFLSMLPLGILVAQDLTIDEIISRNLKAVGQDKLMKMQTMKLTGKMTTGGVELQATQIQKSPNSVRQDLEIQGMKIIMAVYGETGWMVNPATGSSDPQDLTAEMIQSLRKEEIRDPAVNWENPFFTLVKNGTKVELVGKEDIDGSPAYNLKFTFKDGYIINYFVDASKFVVVKSKSTETSQGQTYKQEMRYSDYKDFDGILSPTKVVTIVNGQVGQVDITDKCEFNLPVNDSIFIKPVKK